MDIQTPTLVLNEVRARRNIERMAAKATRSGVCFRPHFKTHQSAQIGQWFREAGVEQITVSSLDMALYFANHGWNDITVAFPVNKREIDKINELASVVKLNLLVESEEIVRYLEENLGFTLDVWLKVDVGYHRTGVMWGSDEAIRVASAIQQADQIKLTGLLTHAGHSYRGRKPEQIKVVYTDTLLKLKALQDRLEAVDVANLKLSIGDTPCCSVVEDFSEVDEIRPGNFVFYDLTQLQIGSCRQEDIALAVACPVVAMHPERNELVIYGGAIHFSKDHITNEASAQVFGAVAHAKGDSWGTLIPNTWLSSVSQEHGIVTADPSFLNKVELGDIVYVIPAHACLTVDLMKSYLSSDTQTYEAMSST